MQPTYLPYCGYFALMDSVDVFVLLDTVDIARQSWQTRNRIQARDGNTVWLSVPVHAKLGQRLDTVQVAQNGWQWKHIRTLHNAYSHTRGFDYILGVDSVIGREWTGLAEMNTALIAVIAQHILGINTRIVRASDLGETRDGKHGRIVDICRAVDASTYVTTTGASYLEENQLEGIELKWFQYDHPTYDQHTAGFTSHLSVLDLIAHSGPEALSTIRNGFYATGCETSAQSATNP